jgi:hypothetical protein
MPQPAIFSTHNPHHITLCGTTHFQNHPKNSIPDSARTISPRTTVEDGSGHPKVAPRPFLILSELIILQPLPNLVA